MAETTVKEFYNGKCIFMTGATGFVGVCLIEKFLRLVPDIGKIYVLLRPKKGKAVSERLDEIKKNSVFDKLKEIYKKNNEALEQLFSKIYPVAGDVGADGLGLSETDLATLCDNVNVVFHSAATLDFEAGFKNAIHINVLGTRRITELCAKIKNLNCLVHISSSYANAHNLNVEEIMYPLLEETEKVIDLVQNSSDEELQKITPKLLGSHPNVYTFTKQMAEHEVAKYQDKYPCVIVRPSQINGAWLEPMPGWTVSKNGPQGFIMGAAKGVIRRLPMPANVICDYIPVDIVINTLIAASLHTATLRPHQVEIYHATSSTRKPFRWRLVEDKINGYLHKYPLKSAVWYPNFRLLPSYTWFKFSAFFVHILPAILLDTVTRVTGGRPILMRLHRNVNKSLALLCKFIFTEWTFSATHTEQLQQWLKADDARDFMVSIDKLDWRDFFISLTQGVRQYLCGESPRTLEAARVKMNILFLVHMSLIALIYICIWYGVASAMGSTLSNTYLVLPFIYFLFSFV